MENLEPRQGKAPPVTSERADDNQHRRYSEINDNRDYDKNKYPGNHGINYPFD